MTWRSAVCCATKCTPVAVPNCTTWCLNPYRIMLKHPLTDAEWWWRHFSVQSSHCNIKPSSKLTVFCGCGMPTENSSMMFGVSPSPNVWYGVWREKCAVWDNCVPEENEIYLDEIRHLKHLMYMARKHKIRYRS